MFETERMSVWKLLSLAVRLKSLGANELLQNTKLLDL